MAEKNDIGLFGDSKWKKTPGGVVLDTNISDFIVSKLLEKSGNEKAKDVFDKLKEAHDWVDDNILAH